MNCNKLLPLFLLSLLTSGCSFNMTRYTDGPLTEYLTEPLPNLDKPIARTFSLEKVSYQTAAGMKAVIISDLVAREIYYLPADVGKEVKQILKLNEAYNIDATRKALNVIAKNRSEARTGMGRRIEMPSSQVTSAATKQYISNQETMAKEAYNKGDYLGGNIHSSAAMNTQMINQSFSQAQATANLSFGVLNSMAAAGQAIMKSEFNKLHQWIESESGAVGAKAPEDRHLSIFFLQFFDAKSFQLDSRNRVAVYAVLTDANGIVESVLEGSDILNCEGECNLFKPKPSAKVFDSAVHSPDVQKLLSEKDGINYLMDNGFDPVSGFYQYILLQHALKKLSG